MERLKKKVDGVSYQVGCIYDYVNNVTTEDGKVKTTAKTLANKQHALFTYKEKYEQLFEELLVDAPPSEVEGICFSYKEFQEKCTATEEIIDIIQDNYFATSVQPAQATADSSTSLL